MHRFVILTHDYPILHWDLMLEKEATLRTWKLFRPPHESGPIEAQRLPDHRLIYLDYEGQVSGNRGEVRRWDAGTFSILSESPDKVVFKLVGTQLHGVFQLRKSGSSDGWTFVNVDPG